LSGQRSGASDPAFVDAVARRVVDLLREEGELAPEGPRLVTVAHVAEEFGVSADWLYANAGALGAIRLGSGPRARVRFDRATIATRIATLASRDRGSRSAGRTRRSAASGEDGGLLPIRDGRA
jgi:hypothetical protein